MATYTVTTTADVVNASDGVLSLREAVEQANATYAADTVIFATALEGNKLILTQGELYVDRDLTIDGDQDNDGLEVTLSGGSHSRVLNSGLFSLTLNDLTLTEGYSGRYGDGGAIYARTTDLTLNGCTIENSNAGYDRYYGKGGAIFATHSTLLVTNSILANNDSGPFGGAIRGESGTSIVLRNSTISDNKSEYGGGISIEDSNLLIDNCRLFSNSGNGPEYGAGGAINARDSSAVIINSSLTYNDAGWSGGAIYASSSTFLIDNSTLSANRAAGFEGGGHGGAISSHGGVLSISNSTLTGNRASGYFGSASGGAITSGVLEIANTIIAGNSVASVYGSATDRDVEGRILLSNGHNIFGSDVLGNNPGDRESIAASTIFATIDPATGGGLVSASGIVPLKNAITNPALSGADPLAASATGQLGGTGRPLPAGSLPDIGSIELNQPLSTKASANNDVLTGTAKANTIGGLAGADYLKGLAGNDTLNGGDGGDLLDGGAGNDKLNGDAGIDLVFYGGSTKVAVDLSLKTDTARRGSETDTLTNVEGAIGSSAADSFKGNEYNNYFQGGGGKDTASGGSGRDLYDFNAIADSKAGATTRDVITDFDHLVDRIDLMGIDADTSLAGNQAFRWVGTAALTGPGEVGWFTSGGNTIIRASNDADAASELEIQLTGIKALTSADFYL